MGFFGKSPYKVVRVGFFGYESGEDAYSETEAATRAATRSTDGNTYAILITSNNKEAGRYQHGKRKFW